MSGELWMTTKKITNTAHTCKPPMEWGFVIGSLGDLWRCECGRLWRIDVQATSYPARSVWLPARWWQRIRYRNRSSR